MVWRHFPREVTHCELFASLAALIIAATGFFTRYNRASHHMLPIIGAKPAIAA